MKTRLLLIFVALITYNKAESQTTDTIRESGFTFVPAELIVNVGDNVFFDGSDVHPILEVSLETWTANATTALNGGFAFPSGTGTVSFSEPGIHYYVCTAHVASQGMKGIIGVTVTDVIKPVTSTDLFTVYPVPLTNGVLTVHFKQPLNEKNVEINIYDVAGGLVFTGKQRVNNEMNLDLSGFPKGIYLMRLNADGIVSSTKLVKE